MPDMQSLASGIASLYPRQIGVARKEMKLEEMPDGLEDVLANSDAVQRLGFQQQMVIDQMRDRARWTPKPDGLPRGSSFCPDDATLARRIVQARGVAEAIALTAEPGSISEWSWATRRS